MQPCACLKMHNWCFFNIRISKVGTGEKIVFADFFFFFLIYSNFLSFSLSSHKTNHLHKSNANTPIPR